MSIMLMDKYPVQGSRHSGAGIARRGIAEKESAMPLTAEQRENRARDAANARWHPDADPADLEAAEQARIDEHIKKIKAAGRRGTITPEQEAILRRAFRYGPAPEQ
jgi:hypothetical protein